MGAIFDAGSNAAHVNAGELGGGKVFADPIEGTQLTSSRSGQRRDVGTPRQPPIEVHTQQVNIFDGGERGTLKRNPKIGGLSGE
jgi:hypothetical protein